MSLQTNSPAASRSADARCLSIALAGNPNTGKSTLFNALTGARQHTGNWPGKTVERKEGEFVYEGRTIRVMDLPGTYSLTAVSPEEVVARDHIVTSHPDAVIVIVDATNLERNLYLVLQVLELTDHVVVALNMMDQLKSKGLRLDPEALSQELGVPCVPIVALRKEGVPELLDAVVRVADGQQQRTEALRMTYSPELQSLIAATERRVLATDAQTVAAGYPSSWLAIKLLEGDQQVRAMLSRGDGPDDCAVPSAQAEPVDHAVEIQIAEERYEAIARIARRAIRYDDSVVSPTDRIDNVVTHKVLGIPILAVTAGVTLWAIYNVAGPVGGVFDWLFGLITGVVSGWLEGTPWWVSGVIIDGVLLGMQQLFVFMFGVLVVFFFIYGILEDVGYLARGAFVVDRLMQWLGLPGKAFMTLFAGYGCSIPGVMGTRIIEDESDRVTTAFVVPFIPCAARIAVITTIVPAFFGTGLGATLVTLGLFVLSLLVVGAIAYALKHTVFKGDVAGLVMEMPDYRPPLLSNVLRTTWDRTYGAMSKAVAVFLPFSVLIYLLFHLPVGAEAADTYGMMVGHWLDPIGKVIGLAGRDMAGFLFTYPAKELSLLYLGLSYGGVGEEAIANFMGGVWSPLQSLSYLAFLTLYAPCFATVAAMAREIGWKWAIRSMGISLVVGFVAAGAIFWIGTALGA